MLGKNVVQQDIKGRKGEPFFFFFGGYKITITKSSPCLSCVSLWVCLSLCFSLYIFVSESLCLCVLDKTVENKCYNLGNFEHLFVVLNAYKNLII